MVRFRTFNIVAMSILAVALLACGGEEPVAAPAAVTMMPTAMATESVPTDTPAPMLIYRHGNSQSDGHAYAGADADTHSETNGYPPTNRHTASDPDAHASADADTHSAPAGGAGNGAA